MMKLTIGSLLVFIVMTVLAVCLVGDGENVIIDTFSRADRKNQLHYFFTIRSANRRYTIEVTKAVYNSHGYGDQYDPGLVKDGGYNETYVEPVGNDQGQEPD